jgi:hypothetical protein
MFCHSTLLNWIQKQMLLHGNPGSGIRMYKDKNSSSTMGPLANALELFEISTNHMAGLTNDQDGELFI